MVSVHSNLALCSGVIDLKSVVEAVRAAERCFPVAQLVAKAPQTRLFGALGGGGGCCPGPSTHITMGGGQA